jgi:hypothetical protein
MSLVSRYIFGGKFAMSSYVIVIAVAAVIGLIVLVMHTNTSKVTTLNNALGTDIEITLLRKESLTPETAIIKAKSVSKLTVNIGDVLFMEVGNIHHKHVIHSTETQALYITLDGFKDVLYKTLVKNTHKYSITLIHLIDNRRIIIAELPASSFITVPTYMDMHIQAVSTKSETVLVTLKIENPKMLLV